MASWALRLASALTSIDSTQVPAYADKFDAAVSLNSSVPDIISASHILPRILDFFLPGYGYITDSVQDILGIDINLLLYVFLSVYVLSQTKTALEFLTEPILKICTCSFSFNNRSKAYQEFTEWAEKRGIGHAAQNVRVDIGDPDFEDLTVALKAFDPASSVTINSAPKQLSYLPSYNREHWFWYKWRLFRFQHWEKPVKQDEESGAIVEARLSCIGFSTKPLTALLNDILYASHLEDKSMTRIWWPVSGRSSWYYGHPWQRLGNRRSRPIRSIIVDQQQKTELLKDIAEFLDQDTATWYAERGLPYRRGYLFRGVPGTGKTSLSFAVAGIFRLDIYVLSLQDPDIKEHDLMRLFQTLPTKCVIVLEDIDSAGIKNRGADVDKSKSTSKGSRKKKGDDSSADDQSSNGISLSGLLNVIDGIASKEGRILIMTTNDAGSLDPALIRPGRIDFTVDFTLLSQKNSSELFHVMYQRSLSSVKPAHDAGKELEKLALEASTFATFIPEATFTPAEVQGYLLTKKYDPSSAIAGVESWIQYTLEKRKLGEQKKQEQDEMRLKEEQEEEEEEQKEKKTRPEKKKLVNGKKHKSSGTASEDDVAGSSTDEDVDDV